MSTDTESESVAAGSAPAITSTGPGTHAAAVPSASEPAGLTVNMTVPEAVSALVAEPRFRRFVRFFTGAEAPQTLSSADDARTASDFQATLGLRLLTALLARTAKQVEVWGTENLKRSPACLYISNHRDILLDPAILNRALIVHGKPLPHVVIGDNLLRTAWLRPVFRLCQCIVVQRDLKGKALYEHARRISEFVRASLTGEEPVWIAQRQGRTKDGVDKTEPALLRMLLMAYERAPAEQAGNLHVTPLAISYEMEPCDAAKAASTLGVRTRNSSENRARRDVGDILRGLLQPKGRIRLTIRPSIVLNHAEDRTRSKDRAEVITELAQSVDSEIRQGYAVWPTNYVAYDLLHDTTEHADLYTPEERDAFVDYIEHRATEIEADRDDAVGALFGLYARPVSGGQASIGKRRDESRDSPSFG